MKIHRLDDTFFSCHIQIQQVKINRDDGICMYSRTIFEYFVICYFYSKVLQENEISKNSPKGIIGSLFVSTKNVCHFLNSVKTFVIIQNLFFRQALTNVKNMLKPGGQLFFSAFEKVFTDDVFERLDQGKWSKYNHEKAISPFYKYDNPAAEYENVIKNVGFEDCHIFTETYKPRMSEEFFKGNSKLLLYETLY